MNQWICFFLKAFPNICSDKSSILPVNSCGIVAPQGCSMADRGPAGKCWQIQQTPVFFSDKPVERKCSCSKIMLVDHCAVLYLPSGKPTVCELEHCNMVHYWFTDFLRWWYSRSRSVRLPEGTLWLFNVANWKITTFNGKIHYKWPFSIAMVVLGLSSSMGNPSEPACHGSWQELSERNLVSVSSVFDAKNRRICVWQQWMENLG